MPPVDQSPPRERLPEHQARLAIHAARTTVEALLKCPELRDADMELVILAVLSTTVLIAGDAGMNVRRMIDALAAQVQP